MPALHAMRPTAAAAPAVCEHARRQAGGADAPRGRASQRRRTQQQAHGALAEQAGAEQLHAVAPRARDKILQDRRARAAHSALGGRCGAAVAPAAAPAALGALHACIPGAGLQASVSQGGPPGCASIATLRQDTLIFLKVKKGGHALQLYMQ